MTARKAPEVATVPEPETATPPAAEIAETPAPEVEAAADAKPSTADAEAPEVEADEVAIVMMVTVSGTHDGEPWPGRGQPVTLPRADAEEYLRLGYATPADPVD